MYTCVPALFIFDSFWCSLCPVSFSVTHYVLICPFTHSFLQFLLHVYYGFSAMVSTRCIEGLMKPYTKSHDGGRLRMLWGEWRGESNDPTWGVGSEKISRGKALMVAWHKASSQAPSWSTASCGNSRAMLPGRNTGRNAHMTRWDFGLPGPITELTLTALCLHYQATV